MSDEEIKKQQNDNSSSKPESKPVRDLNENLNRGANIEHFRTKEIDINKAKNSDEGLNFIPKPRISQEDINPKPSDSDKKE